MVVKLNYLPLTRKPFILFSLFSSVPSLSFLFLSSFLPLTFLLLNQSHFPILCMSSHFFSCPFSFCIPLYHYSPSHPLPFPDCASLSSPLDQLLCPSTTLNSIYFCNGEKENMRSLLYMFSLTVHRWRFWIHSLLIAMATHYWVFRWGLRISIDHPFVIPTHFYYLRCDYFSFIYVVSLSIALLGVCGR